MERNKVTSPHLLPFNQGKDYNLENKSVFSKVTCLINAEVINENSNDILL